MSEGGSNRARPPRLRIGRALSLRTQLALALGTAASLPLIVGFGLYAHRQEVNVTEQKLALYQQDAQAASHEIDGDVALHVAAAVSVAGTPGLLALAPSAQEAFLHALKTVPPALAIETFDASGTAIARSDSLPLVHKTGTSIYDSVRSTQAPAVDLVPTSAFGRPVFEVVATVVGPTGSLAGLVSLTFDGVTNALDDPLGSGGRAYILDRNGLMMTQTDSAGPIGMLDSPGKPLLSLIQESQQGDNQTASGNQLYAAGQQQWVAGYAFVPSLGSWVVIEQPVAEALAALSGDRDIVLLVLMIALALALIGGLLAARWLTAPLAALSRAVQAMDEGATPVPLPLSSVTEIAALSASFGQMRARLVARSTDLQTLNEQLEHRVLDRTADLTRTSEQLAIASQHKSEFLANMSHELRTPLNAILGFSELLHEQLFGALNEKQLDYVADVLTSGRHLLALINDILDLSKVEAGQMELDLGAFVLREALESGVTMVRERAGSHGVALSLDVEPGLDVIKADERKVKQIMFNLLSNSVKFTPAGGQVAIRARQTADGVEISVRDTGIGIALEDQARVFDTFQQVRTAVTIQHEGTGLGLALVRQLVELHGGRIWLESTPGQGSTFTFTLPTRGVEAAEAPPVPKIDTRLSPLAAVGSDLTPHDPLARRVLIIDDDHQARKLLQFHLEDAGFDVAFARNGVEGLARVQAAPPDAVVLDIQMPGGDGWEFLAQIKANPILAAVPVMVVSVVDARNRGLAMGAAAYLVKPVERTELLAALRRMLPPAERPLISPLAASEVPARPRLTEVADGV